MDGDGVAFLEDSYAKSTVAYLAKFKQPASTRGALPGILPREKWEQMTEAEREAVKAGVLSDYPAYRNAALEDSSNTLYLPMGAGFNYYASGNDLSQISCAFRWSEESRRYIGTPPEFYWPDKWRKRAENKKLYRDWEVRIDRKSTRLNSSHSAKTRMPSSA